jgi:spore maturation protein CgeB
LVARDGKEMAAHLRHLIRDPQARRQLAGNGLNAIRQRHTCAHRAQELLSICQEIAG